MDFQQLPHLFSPAHGREQLRNRLSGRLLAKLLLNLILEGRSEERAHMVTVKCPSCDHENAFDQPYAFHAGFGDEGFLYNEDGNLTLTWSSFDPAYEAIVGQHNPWALTPEQRLLVEVALRPAPRGGRWRFSNPARCASCKGLISGPITETIYYLIYPGSVRTDRVPREYRLAEILI